MNLDNSMREPVLLSGNYFAAPLRFLLVFTVLLCHAALLIYAGWVHSPVWHEPAQIAAGVAAWNTSDFSIYRVNPPLVRLVCSAPLAFEGHDGVGAGSFRFLQRPEFAIGQDFASKFGPHLRTVVARARWACVIFSVTGGLFCFMWAKKIFGYASGILALLLWSFSPSILGHAALCMNDVAAASLAAASCYMFAKWLDEISLFNTVTTGVAMGLAQLAKFTCLVLYPIFTAIIIMHLFRHRYTSEHSGCHAMMFGSLGMLGVSLVVVNAGYFFQGTCSSLSSYDFASVALGGKYDEVADTINRGNIFRESSLHWLPIPLPRQYVLGIDEQKVDFERGMKNYLRGQWKQGGWLHYYVYGLALKTPLSTILLVVLAGLAATASANYRSDWLTELLLLLPVVVIVVLVSSQTGVNRHLRYMLPILPFVFVSVSRLALSASLHHYWLGALSLVALSATIYSAVSVYPHGLSYFNALAGGPIGARKHVLGSNIDWGQDLFLLRAWLQDHPEVDTALLDVESIVLSPDLGFNARQNVQYPSSWTIVNREESRDIELSAKNNWKIISANRLYGRDRIYDDLKEREPYARIGYTIDIFHCPDPG